MSTNRCQPMSSTHEPVKPLTKTFSITIPKDLHSDLVSARKATGRSQAFLIETGIRMALKAYGPDNVSVNVDLAAPVSVPVSAHGPVSGPAPGHTPARALGASPGPVSDAGVGILPRSEPSSKPITAPDPGSDLPLDQRLAGIKARKEGPQVWFELQPVLNAYRVKREDLIPECNPDEDIPQFDGIEHIDTVCRRLIDGLSTVGYEIKNQINDHMNAISAQLLL